ncbi:MAG TPA: DNA starvation/stationary phase protection protein [Candidatus Dependentiae bacterium]|nr:DNA starvation/stationary phase protection protein [Candidatus Dependentiae bacterium]HRQ62338.1 DNA starvation/stationary phase protection protein [Candidatus Dependentiae bacterium]
MKKLLSIISLCTLISLNAQEQDIFISMDDEQPVMQDIQQTDSIQQPMQQETMTFESISEQQAPQEIMQPTSSAHAMQSMVNIGLPQEARMQVAELLRTLLANEYVLYVKTQKFHWNVQGPLFGPLHKLFSEQYTQLAMFIDSIAERSLALGFKSIGTLQEFMQYTTIQEMPGQNPDDQEMIKELLQNHEMIIKQLRTNLEITSKLNDMGTNNFLNDLLEKHEKIAWMLRAHLQ